MNVQSLIQEGTYQRNYRKCELNSSINPAIAYAMNQLAGLNDNDRILDPTTGSATILIERQLLKTAICVGVDIDPRALECAKRNIEAANVDVSLKHGDIRTLKFSEGYFTKIIANLPFGIHTSSREKNKELYRFLADKAINWLKVGGKAIFLTNAKSLLRNSFQFNLSWELESEIPIIVGGLNLSIFIFRRVK